jgi:hypothetical protein
LEHLFSLSGNPGQGPFSLSYRGVEPLQALVRVNDTEGRSVLNKEKRFDPGMRDLDIHLDGEGIYFVVIQSGDARVTFKLIKQ